MIMCVAGDVCRGQGYVDWAYPGPLCVVCLESIERDIRALTLDYLDLEQLLPRVTTRVERVSGTPELSVPIALPIDAFQAEIAWTVTMWEEVLRDAEGLPPLPVGRTRVGWAVQRATRFLAGRVLALACLGPCAVLPSGPQGPPEDMTGVDAIQSMTALHVKARATLKLTRKVDALPGECWLGCGYPTLRRESGSETVFCATCDERCTWDDYREHMGLINGDVALSGRLTGRAGA